MKRKMRLFVSLLQTPTIRENLQHDKRQWRKYEQICQMDCFAVLIDNGI